MQMFMGDILEHQEEHKNIHIQGGVGGISYGKQGIGCIAIM